MTAIRSRLRDAGGWLRSAPTAPAAHEAPEDAPPGFSGVVHVFEAKSASVVPLRDYLVSVWERRAFIAELARAQIRGPRADTVLGRLWALLDPLLLAAIYFFLFTVLRRGSGGRTLDFLPVLLAGVFLFGMTTAAIGEGGRSIRGGKSLMLNSTFPRALLPMVAIYRKLIELVPAVPVVFLTMLLFEHSIGPGITFLPLLLVIQLVMNVGFALLFSTLIVFFRDTSNALNHATRVLFFVTPVIYPASTLPPNIKAILVWQPLYALFESYQRVFSGRVPSPSMVVFAMGWAALFLVLGTRIFRRHERDFANHL